MNRPVNRPVRLAAITLALVPFLVACASKQLYEGPSRSGDEVSVIRAWIPRPATGAPGDEEYDVRMIGVDEHMFEGHERTVEVLPGTHQVHLSWKKWRMPRALWGNSDSDMIIWQEIGAGHRTMDVEVEAGKKYRLIVPWETAGKDWYFAEYGNQRAEYE